MMSCDGGIPKLLLTLCGISSLLLSKQLVFYILQNVFDEYKAFSLTYSYPEI